MYATPVLEEMTQSTFIIGAASCQHMCICHVCQLLRHIFKRPTDAETSAATVQGMQQEGLNMQMKCVSAVWCTSRCTPTLFSTIRLAIKQHVAMVERLHVVMLQANCPALTDLVVTWIMLLDAIWHAKA